jgi:hypothetical protein
MRARRSLDPSAQAHGYIEANAESLGLPGSVEDLLDLVAQGAAAPHPNVARTAVTPHAPASNRQQPTVELLSQVYDAILADRRLPRESLPLLSRLYPAVLRQTLLDPNLLADANHPVWRFMDHLGFLMQTCEVGDRQANVAFAQGLVEQLVTQHSADARPFQSAANRLVVLERQRFARAVSAAADDIAMLGARAQESGDPGPTLPQSLDAGGAESRPAPLRRGSDNEAEPAEAALWRAGSWLSIFLRGHWRRALVLWRAPNHGPLLLLDANEARHWAVRGAAIERLAKQASGPRYSGHRGDWRHKKRYFRHDRPAPRWCCGEARSGRRNSEAGGKLAPRVT